MSMEKSYTFYSKNNCLMKDGQLLVTTDCDLSALTEMLRVESNSLDLKVLSKESFNELLEEQFAGSKDDSSDLKQLLALEGNLKAAADEAEARLELLDRGDDTPVVKLFNAMLIEAIRRSASDIHIEPFDGASHIRMRIDGALVPVLTPAFEVASRLVARVKVLAKLDIAEKRLPQDGRMTVSLANRDIDLRISTMPSVHGERVVMRILEKQSKNLDVQHLGMQPNQLERLQRLLAKPNGIVLVTGPTGSGKTTTLYAALREIVTSDRNIMTIEDPVEYELPGVSQAQTSEKAGFTFARGLKAILRQDPDVILVGEIRDNETATIATQASLTGHLVLSTLHTNTIAGAISRMSDLGVEPFLLSSSLRGVISQRLVRKLCAHCKTEVTPSESQLSIFTQYGMEAPATLSSACGCDVCGHTGFAGRQGIYDIAEVTAELRELVHHEAGELAYEKVLSHNGGGLTASGLALAASGITTVDEVLKVSID